MSDTEKTPTIEELRNDAARLNSCCRIVSTEYELFLGILDHIARHADWIETFTNEMRHINQNMTIALSRISALEQFNERVFDMENAPDEVRAKPAAEKPLWVEGQRFSSPGWSDLRWFVERNQVTCVDGRGSVRSSAEPFGTIDKIESAIRSGELIPADHIGDTTEKIEVGDDLVQNAKAYLRDNPPRRGWNECEQQAWARVMADFARSHAAKQPSVLDEQVGTA